MQIYFSSQNFSIKRNFFTRIMWGKTRDLARFFSTLCRKIHFKVTNNSNFWAWNSSRIEQVQTKPGSQNKRGYEVWSWPISMVFLSTKIFGWFLWKFPQKKKTKQTRWWYRECLCYRHTSEWLLCWKRLEYFFCEEKIKPPRIL